FIRENEGRHRLARLRRRFAGATVPKPLHQPVNRIGEIGAALAHRLRKRLQLIVEGRIHAADALEPVLDALAPAIVAHRGKHNRVNRLAARGSVRASKCSKCSDCFKCSECLAKMSAARRWKPTTMLASTSMVRLASRSKSGSSAAADAAAAAIVDP